MSLTRDGTWGDRGAICGNGLVSLRIRAARHLVFYCIGVVLSLGCRILAQWPLIVNL